MKSGTKVRAVHQTTGEQICFDTVKDAAAYAKVKPTTMSWRLKNRTVDSNGWLYLAEEMSEEHLEKRARRMKYKTIEVFKSDDVELEPKFLIIKYEVINLRESITPCPFRDTPKPMVGSGKCLMCTSFRGRNKKIHAVACNRHYM